MVCVVLKEEKMVQVVFVAASHSVMVYTQHGLALCFHQIKLQDEATTGFKQ
jgi:hypothetical protein